MNSNGLKECNRENFYISFLLIARHFVEIVLGLFLCSIGIYFKKSKTDQESNCEKVVTK